MRWLELTVEADVEAIEAISEIFGRLGRGAAVRPTQLIRDPGDELAVREDPDAPYLVSVHIPEDAAAASAIESTERSLWHLQAFGLRPLGPLQVSPVDDADWMGAWRADYAPQRIGRIVIVPSWLEEPIGPGEVGIRLDPGMAFGTGLHPTTRGCLTLLQELGSMPPAMLDVGSGSGILGIAALQLGVARVVALDTDPLAVAATRANAAANGVADRLTALGGTLPAEPTGTVGRYPLIAANLVASLIVELAPALAAHLEPRGRLLASGIIEPRAEEVIVALAARDLEVTRRLDDGEWTSLALELAR